MKKFFILMVLIASLGQGSLAFAKRLNLSYSHFASTSTWLSNPCVIPSETREGGNGLSIEDPTSEASCKIWFPIDLPTGTKVSKVEVNFYDNSENCDLRVNPVDVDSPADEPFFKYGTSTSVQTLSSLSFTISAKQAPSFYVTIYNDAKSADSEKCIIKGASIYYDMDDTAASSIKSVGTVKGGIPPLKK
jgi:hypothetical protein